MDITDELGHGTTIAGIISNVAPQPKIVSFNYL
jgi:lantibiotic leader peptide-processing serine protease